MPRPLRSGKLNAVYHVTNRGVEKRPIFITDRDKRVFLAYLRRDLRQDGASLFAYCLMSNHYHLLVYVDKVALDVTIQRAMTRYAIYFNRVYGRVGHLFQGRYNAELCTDYAYLIQAVTYIHKNPVEAGLVRHASDWPWSSHGEWMAMQGPLIDFERFEEATEMTRQEMRAFYRDRIDAPDTPTHTKPRALDSLIEEAALIAGLAPKDLQSGRRGPRITRAKLLLFEWTQQNGISDTVVAQALNCTQGAVAHLRSRRKS